MDIVAANGRHALVSVVRAALTHGTRVSPRGIPTRELRHFSVMIEDPYDTLCIGINAKQSQRLVAAEAIQLIGAFGDAKFAVKHAPGLAAFVNPETGEFDGAYGPRAVHLVGAIIERLKRDPDTRQAILPIWRPFDVLREGSRDYPCTLTLGFFIRHHQLELDVTMRSNDINWGFKNDIFQFSQLQLSIAATLGMRAGPYRHTAYSMHLYERDLDWAEGLDDTKTLAKIDGHPAGVDGARSVEEMMERARAIAYDDPVASETPSERWYRTALNGGHQP